jgi:hypothetical protein
VSIVVTFGFRRGVPKFYREKTGALNLATNGLSALSYYRTVERERTSIQRSTVLSTYSPLIV